MFERYTDRARRVIVLAQEEARMLNHNYIGTEHLLLGLLKEDGGVAGNALESLGISLEAVREKVEELIGRGKDTPEGHIAYTPRVKKVLELSLREALQLNHNYIGTEHILLALIREGEGVAAQVLVELGADLNRTRNQVLSLLSSSPQVQEAPSEPEQEPTPTWPSRRSVLETERARLLPAASTIEKRLAAIDEELSYLCPECDQAMRAAGEAVVCEGCGYTQAA